MLIEKLGVSPYMPRKTKVILANDKQVSTEPRPFLRWAGGKRRVLPHLLEKMPLDFAPGKTRVFEPFVGGGAFAFSLGIEGSKHYTPGKNLFINDVNEDLVCAYVAIRDNPKKLIEKLEEIVKTKSKAEFERIKKSSPKSSIERAARFIYLNRTCFNGLWRVNSRGEFNVPWGKLKNPLIFDEQNILNCHVRLRDATITNLDFSLALKTCKEGDFVYLDPPYIPLTPSSSFSKYAKGDFGLGNHLALAETIEKLTLRGVRVLLSNSDTKTTREIYGDVMNFQKIQVQRSISANSSSRISVGEIIGTNYLK